MSDESTQTNMGFSPGIASQQTRYVGSKGHWFIFALALLLHFIDTGRIFFWKLSSFPYIGSLIGAGFEGTGFDGINFAYLWKLGFTEVGWLIYTETSLFFTFLVIFFYFLLFRRGHSWEEFGSKIALWAVIILVLFFCGVNSIIDLARNPLTIFGAGLHLLLIFVIKNSLLKNYSPTDANYYAIFIIFADFFLFNAIQFFFPLATTELNRIIFPVLPLVALMFMEDTTTKNSILFIIIVLYLLLFVSTSNTIRLNAQAKLSSLEKSSGDKATMTMTDRWNKFWTGVKTSWNQTNQIIQGNYYPPEYYQSEEEMARKTLGVFLEKVEASDKEYSENETITVWANLKVYTLEDKNISVNVTCNMDNMGKSIVGKVNDKEGSKVFKDLRSFEEEFITCTFDNVNKLNITTGYHNVYINATFNFETNAYLKTYYIDRDRKRVFLSENVDVFEQYGITDTEPVAKFTSGPIKIGMETTTPAPIGVPPDKEGNFGSFIGVSIDNNWQGNVKKIDYLYLSLPQGLSINEQSCTDFTPYSDKNKNANVGLMFELKKDVLDLKNEKQYYLPKSFKCALKINNRTKLLGENQPISMQYFLIWTSYTYIITEKTGVTVVRKDIK